MAVRTGTTGEFNYIADTVAGFDYVVLMKRRGVNIRVTSNSYATNPRTAYSQALIDAMDRGGRRGHSDVFSAMNSSLMDIYPLPFYPGRL